jgi:hypothetical protein
MGGSGPDVGAADPQPSAYSTTTPAAGAAANPPVASAAGSGDQIDVRKYIGPNYCPEIRVQPGTEMLRRYEAGHEGDAGFVISQASVGKTARECLYDLQGNLTMKIGVSGRVVAGPKGAPGTVPVPLRIAVVRYKEATLASEKYPLQISVPETGSATFSEVHEITVPAPGKSRNYLVYVGLAEDEADLLEPEKKAAVAAAKVAAAKAAAEKAAQLAAERSMMRPVVRKKVIRKKPPPQGPANVLPVPEGYGAPSG